MIFRHIVMLLSCHVFFLEDRTARPGAPLPANVQMDYTRMRRIYGE